MFELINLLYNYTVNDLIYYGYIEFGLILIFNDKINHHFKRKVFNLLI